MSAALTEAEELPGTTKVAVLMMSLGKDRAAALLRQLSEPEAAAVLGEVANLQKLDPRLIDGVIEHFARTASQTNSQVSGGKGYVRELLTASYSDERALSMANRMGLEAGNGRFRFLADLDDDTLTKFVCDEHPQTIAVVMAHLTADRAAKILAGFEEELQRDVAVRLATMERTHPTALDAIERTLAIKAESLVEEEDEVLLGGVDSIVALLTNSEKAVERAVIEELMQHDPVLAELVRDQLFVFDDIAELDDRAIQQILRQVDSRQLGMALKSATKALSEKMMSNMSSRAAQDLREEIELLPKLRAADVEEARKAIVRVVRALEDSGEIVIDRGGDDDAE